MFRSQHLKIFGCQEAFLHQWMLKKRAFRFGEMDRQACRTLIDEVDQVVNLSSNENVRVEELRQVLNGYVARELRQLEALAFNGKKLGRARPMLAMPFGIRVYVDVSRGRPSKNCKGKT